MSTVIDEQPVAEVISWPERPRHALAKKARLMQSVREHGVEHHIPVVSREEYLRRLPQQANSVKRCYSYVAICDYNWLEAARSVGLSHVPVLVRPMPYDSIAAYVLRLHSHDDRLGPMDVARLLHSGLNAPGQTKSQNAFAEELGPGDGLTAPGAPEADTRAAGGRRGGHSFHQGRSAAGVHTAQSQPDERGRSYLRVTREVVNRRP